MKFPVLPVRSGRDATLNFEQLLKAVEPGVWTNPESFSAKTEEHESLQVRLEQFGAAVRIKGFFKAKEAIPALTTVFTLTAPFRPKEIIRLAGHELSATPRVLAYINTNGTVEVREELLIGRFAGFDGLTFNLT